MPRLTPEVRDARRQQIADATLHCLATRGLAGTSMADIISESGLSAGSIYSHFESKAEILRHAAGTIVERRRPLLVEEDSAPGPRRVGELVLTRLLPAELRPVMPQLWAEAASDEALRPVLEFQLLAVRAMLAETLTPWATSRSSSPAEAEALAGARADTVIALMQGYLTRRTLDHSSDDEVLLRNVLSTLEE